jgi:hypothetical protein
MAGENGYTARDMLDKIVIPKLDAIDEKLDNKADRLRVHDLSTEMAAQRLEHRATQLIQEALRDDMREVKRDLDVLHRFRWMTIGAVLILSGMGVPTLLRVWFGIG